MEHHQRISARITALHGKRRHRRNLRYPSRPSAKNIPLYQVPDTRAMFVVDLQYVIRYSTRLRDCVMCLGSRYCTNHSTTILTRTLRMPSANCHPYRRRQREPSWLSHDVNPRGPITPCPLFLSLSSWIFWSLWRSWWQSCPTQRPASRSNREACPGPSAWALRARRSPRPLRAAR